MPGVMPPRINVARAAAAEQAAAEQAAAEQAAAEQAGAAAGAEPARSREKHGDLRRLTHPSIA